MIRSISPKHTLQLSDILQRAIQADKADKGNIQLFFPESESLRIVAQQGFQKDFLDYFKVVKAFDTSACGRAIGSGSPVLISDINQDIAYMAHKAIAQSADYRAVKSVPVITDDKRFLGIISTHYKHPNWNWNAGMQEGIIEELKIVLLEIGSELACGN